MSFSSFWRRLCEALLGFLPRWSEAAVSDVSSSLKCWKHRWPGPPPLHNVGFKKILVETLNNVGHPTRCPQPLNSVRLMVSYIVQCLHKYFFSSPHIVQGRVPATSENKGRFPVNMNIKSSIICADTADALTRSQLEHDHRRRADRASQVTANFTRDRRRFHWHI